MDLVSPQEDRPLGASPVVSREKNGPNVFFALGQRGRGWSEDEHQRVTFPMLTSGGKLKVLRYCRSAEAQTSPSLAISADPGKRRLENDFNL